MKKFIDTLLQLPNLRCLGVLGVTHRTPVTAALKRKCAIFPNVREMVVEHTYPDFIKSCPNLESLRFRRDLDDCASRAIQLYGGGLKRITGVVAHVHPEHIAVIVQSCPKLQEIGLLVDLYVCPPFPPLITVSSTNSLQQLSANCRVLDELRRIEHLTVVGVDFVKHQCPVPPKHSQDELLDHWKHGLIGVLKDSASKDRKFLRWKTVVRWLHWNSGYPAGHQIVGSREMEVFSGMSS